jgi:hypothetical protein
LQAKIKNSRRYSGIGFGDLISGAFGFYPFGRMAFYFFYQLH